MYNLIDRRHGRASTAITSNIELADWGRYLGDAVITTAVLDRLVMNAIRVDIDGPSYRQHVAKQRAKLKRSTATLAPISTTHPPQPLDHYPAAAAFLCPVFIGSQVDLFFCSAAGNGSG